MEQTQINKNVNFVNNRQLFIKQIKASYFRNYKSLELNLSSDNIVLFGLNGVGKTNILEAVSFLSSGRGLRKARSKDLTFKTFDTKAYENYFWGVHAKVFVTNKTFEIGTGINKNNSSRLVKINHEYFKQSDLSKLIKISWITPQMLLLFHNGMQEKRRFIDRLINISNPSHVGLLYRYELLTKERLKIINSYNHNKIWIDSIESDIINLSIQIIESRKKFVSDMQDVIFSPDLNKDYFPDICLQINGEAEELFDSLGEEKYHSRIIQILRKNRQNGITSFIGPHKSEVHIFKRESKQEIKYCSTGEQKIMLISLIFKHCHLMESIYKQTPILLLDDIIEHLDNPHKIALFEKTSQYRSQCWFTCTNSSAFDDYPISYESIDVNKIQKGFSKKSELKYA